MLPHPLEPPLNSLKLFVEGLRGYSFDHSRNKLRER
jgi:hypothetical protein